MKVSENGLAVVKYFEDCGLAAYADPATGGAPWTWGWGHTGPDVKPGGRITQAQADDLLLVDLAEAGRIVLAAVKVPLEQGRFDALVSFCFNVGPGRKGVKDGLVTLRSGNPSTLLRYVNARLFVDAAGQFGLWNKGNGQVMRGLTRRRAAERALFLGASGADAIKQGVAAA
jgi:lysozyme